MTLSIVHTLLDPSKLMIRLAHRIARPPNISLPGIAQGHEMINIWLCSGFLLRPSLLLAEKHMLNNLSFEI